MIEHASRENGKWFLGMTRKSLLQDTTMEDLDVGTILRVCTSSGTTYILEVANNNKVHFVRCKVHGAAQKGFIGTFNCNEICHITNGEPLMYGGGVTTVVQRIELL